MRQENKHSSRSEGEAIYSSEAAIGGNMDAPEGGLPDDGQRKRKCCPHQHEQFSRTWFQQPVPASSRSTLSTMNEVLLHKAGLTVNCILKPPKERREEPVRQAEKKKAKTKKMEVSPRFSPWMAYPGDYNSGLQVSVEPQAGGMKRRLPKRCGQIHDR